MQDDLLSVVPRTQDEPGEDRQSLGDMPEPLTTLSAREKRIWQWLVDALSAYGMLRRTHGALMTFLCHMVDEYLVAHKALRQVMKENNGSYLIQTPNSKETVPNQVYYTVRNARRELLTYLPEAALTLPSFFKLEDQLNESGARQGTLDLEDPVEAHRQRKVAMGINEVQG